MQEPHLHWGVICPAALSKLYHTAVLSAEYTFSNNARGVSEKEPTQTPPCTDQAGLCSATRQKPTVGVGFAV
jgi:hypothetical protein